MRTISKEKLQDILEKHCLWMGDIYGGEAADLSNVDLTGANLYDANLRWADLRSVNIEYTIIRSLQNVFSFSLYWTSNILQIGCINKTHEDWKKMADEDIQKLCEKGDISTEEVQKIKEFVQKYVFKEDVR